MPVLTAAPAILEVAAGQSVASVARRLEVTSRYHWVAVHARDPDPAVLADDPLGATHDDSLDERVDRCIGDLGSLSASEALRTTGVHSEDFSFRAVL